MSASVPFRLSHILWNLFLALLPVGFAAITAQVYRMSPRPRATWWLWGPLALLWLGFRPNSAYLLTEWRHFIDAITRSPETIRAASHDKQALLDFLSLATFYVVYSGMGLLTFSMSIWPLAQIAKPGWAVRAGFFFACAVGVYLGLVKRLNTWDLWHRPELVAQSSIEALAHPLLLLLTIGFAAVLWLNYWIFEVFVDGLALRLSRAGYLRKS